MYILYKEEGKEATKSLVCITWEGKGRIIAAMAVLKEKTKGLNLLTVQPKPHNYTDTILPSRHFYDF